MKKKSYRGWAAAAAALTVAGALSLADPSPARAGETITTTTTTYPTGTMTVVSQEKRTFRVGDTTVVYTAPPSIDLSSLAGSNVRVEVLPDGRVSRVTRVESTTTTID